MSKKKVTKRTAKLSATDLINDLKAVAKELDVKSVSIGKYLKHGKHSAAPFIKAFGSWNAANIKAGLKAHVVLTEKEMLDDIKKVAKAVSPAILTMTNYAKNGGLYSHAGFGYKFGGWSQALVKAGVFGKREMPRSVKKISEADLIADVRRISKGRVKNSVYTNYEKSGKYSNKTLFLRFGLWNKVLAKAGLPINPKRK